MTNLLGIYEKAFSSQLAISEKLRKAKELGFDFLELSVDESDERIRRLYYDGEELGRLRQEIWKSGVPVNSICLSTHRRYPLGSRDPAVREQALELTEKAIRFACGIGARIIQLAGYDVYYELSSDQTRRNFMNGLRQAMHLAERYQMTLAIEIMDTTFLNSITKYLELKREVPSPWLKVYPDLGNLTAWGNNLTEELRRGADEIVAVHLKDTQPVSPGFPGKFRDVPFGRGNVDFPVCFRTLNELHYAGPYLIEMWASSSSDPDESIKDAKRFVLAQMSSL